MKTKGSGLIFLGLLLIAAAVGLVCWNTFQDTRAGTMAAQDMALLLEQSAAVESAPADAPTVSSPTEEPADYLLVPEMEMPVKEVDGREYVGTLELPTLDRTLPVLNGWDYELLQVAPCRYEGSAYTGNLIIMAHNYDSHFGRLKNLQIGDPVTFRDVEGNTFSYQVASLETLNPTDTEEMEAGDWDLTLFTCTIGGKYRVTVRCSQIPGT